MVWNVFDVVGIMDNLIRVNKFGSQVRSILYIGRLIDENLRVKIVQKGAQTPSELERLSTIPQIQSLGFWIMASLGFVV
jgi:hypothetical protein